MAINSKNRPSKKQPHMSKAARTPVICAFATLLIVAALCLYVVFFVEIPVPPPAAQPVRVVAWTQTQTAPHAFISEVTGENLSIYYEYFDPVAYITGEVVVVVSLADEHGNVTQVVSELYAYRPREHITAAIGDDISMLGIAGFIDGNILTQDEQLFSLITDLSSIDTSKVGSFEIEILLSGTAPPVPVIIEIIDIIPPQGRGVVVERWSIDELDPNDFVDGIIDQSEVTVEFLEQPDRTIEGEQKVQILLTDESGNTAVVTSTLIQKHDTEPPQITGELDKAICIGETILYRSGITVTDNRDEHVTLEIDSSAVNPSVEGVYPVIYSATDESGNTATVEGSLTVYALDIERIETMIDEIAQSILNDDMTQREKAQAVFNYVKGRIAYGAGTVYDNVHYAAYRALTSGLGDCFAYYSISELLLNAADIDNMRIERKPGYPTRHFWNLINLGEGWYHFDALPQGQSGGFMFTSSQAREITIRAQHVIPGYYDYDETLYPELVQ